MNKDGLATMTKIMEHACRLINKYSSKMTTFIHLAAEEGTITVDQMNTLLAFIASINAACAILKLVTGY